MNSDPDHALDDFGLLLAMLAALVTVIGWIVWAIWVYAF
jgi:hypothetical protein